jgi:hypothetical protein
MHGNDLGSAWDHHVDNPSSPQVDAKDKLYLLWSSSTRLEDTKHFTVNVDVAKKVKQNSLNIDAQLKLPKFIRSVMMTWCYTQTFRVNSGWPQDRESNDSVLHT